MSITSTPRQILGQIDHLTGCGVGGWLLDPAAPERARIEVFLDDRPAGIADSGLLRPDLRDARGYDRLGFHFHFPGCWRDGGEHRLLLRLGDEGPVLFGGEQQVRLDSLPDEIQGHLDRCDGFSIGGWLFDPEAPENAVVEILVDGALVAETAADLPRPDLMSTFGHELLGFFHEPWPVLQDDAEHEVTLRLKRTGETLFGGARTVGSADAQASATPRARMTYPILLPKDTRFFFLAGSMKSGTTWLMHVLGAHPDVCSRGEMHPLEFLGGPPTLESVARNADTLKKWYMMPNSSWNVPFRGEERSATALRHLETDHVRFFYEWTILRYLEARGESFPRIVGDKSPSHTSSIVETLQRHFGVYQPHVIHIIRDPRDVAVSSWFHLRRLQSQGSPCAETPFRDEADREACLRLLADPDREREPDEPFFRYPGHLERVLDEWRTVNESLVRDAPDAFGDRYVCLRYEDLKSDFDAVVGALLDRLEIDRSDPRIADIRERTDVTKLKVKPSVFRKGAVGDHVRYFRDEDHAVFLARTRAFSQRFGYV